MKITILVIATILACKTIANDIDIKEDSPACVCNCKLSCGDKPKQESPLPPPASCQEQKKRAPKSPSGMYLIAASKEKTEYVYCNMDTLCGSEGGWTRVGYLDITNSKQICPKGTRLYQKNGVRACGRPATGGASCVTVGLYQSYGLKYTQVCGRIRGYQFGSPDGFHTNVNDVNSNYADGISLTIGSPRKHLYTFASGINERGNGAFECPCNQDNQKKVQSFIGQDYYCESGNPASGWTSNVLYTDDPLWDGKQCNQREKPCCKNPNLPFFHKTLQPTSDYIEARICENEGTNNEDVTIDQLEIYIK